jgi:hypothetical protein
MAHTKAATASTRSIQSGAATAVPGAVWPPRAPETHALCAANCGCNRSSATMRPPGSSGAGRIQPRCGLGLAQTSIWLRWFRET